MKIYDQILQGDEATEENALDCAASMVWSECEALEQHIKYYYYVDTINGIGVYYDYGADYYFFTDEGE